MDLSKWEYGILVTVFGMGLTLLTLYILIWVMRFLTFICREKGTEANKNQGATG